MVFSVQVVLWILIWVFNLHLSPVSTINGAWKSIGSLNTSSLQDNYPHLEGAKCIVNLTPRRLTVYAGDTVKLTCRYHIRGNGSIMKLAVHWEKQVNGLAKSLWIAESYITEKAVSKNLHKIDATNVVDRHYIASSVEFPEFLSSHTLWIQNVESQDSGDYQCSVIVEKEHQRRHKKYTQQSSDPSVIIVRVTTGRRIGRQSGSLKSSPNLALGKPTWQSSLYKDNVPSRAVDGHTDGILENKHCSHTDLNVNPWWGVDLQKNIHINSVVIANRLVVPGQWDSSHRLSKIRIGTTNTDPEMQSPTINNIHLCVSQEDPLGSGEIRAFPCYATGRFVIIFLEKKEVLTLCEVEVYGSISDAGTTNLAVGKPSDQSSICWVITCFGSASLAVDGKFNVDFNAGSCARTRIEITPWWTVDLQVNIQIEEVGITNMLRNPDLPSNLSLIRIGTANNDPKEYAPTLSNINMCVRHDEELGSGETRFFPCWTTGRWVVIILANKEYLTLCEVQVYGSPAANDFALGKPTKQSSTEGLADASRAVDGNSDSNFDLGHSCTLTTTEWSPWWGVDLNMTVDITEVVITTKDDNKYDSGKAYLGCYQDGDPRDLGSEVIKSNSMTPHYCIQACRDMGRKYAGVQNSQECYCGNSYGSYWATNCDKACSGDSSQICGGTLINSIFSTGRLSSLIIGITDTYVKPTDSNINVCAVQDKLLKQTCAIPCHASGKHVFIVVQEKTSLTLCEVKVHGQIPATNFARGKPASQSSTHEMMYASRAVDGNSYSDHIRGKSCTRTKNELHPWWAVDLTKLIQIQEVVITNRIYGADRLSMIRIGTTDNHPDIFTPNIGNINVCARKDEALIGGETYAFPCKATSRIIVIILEKMDMLSLCEVKVFGQIVIESSTGIDSTATEWNMTETAAPQTDGLSPDHTWIIIGVSVSAAIIIIAIAGIFLRRRLQQPVLADKEPLVYMVRPTNENILTQIIEEFPVVDI